jgi:pimeloyl-ACP methyl ester carboxylesterase
MGRLVEVADTKLYVEERGEPSAFPLLVFHGGPGLDHTWFADYLDPLTEGGSYRLVLAGRHDRTCAAGASQDMARRLPDAELVVFEKSAHMMFAEEQDRFLVTLRRFLDRITG